MTARADRLTKRAKPPDQARSVLSSDPASTVRVFVDALERLDDRMEPLLAAAGISRPDLDDPDTCIPCTVWVPMSCRALEERPMKNASGTVPRLGRIATGVLDRRPRGDRHGPAVAGDPRINPDDAQFPVWSVPRNGHHARRRSDGRVRSASPGSGRRVSVVRHSLENLSSVVAGRARGSAEVARDWLDAGFRRHDRDARAADPRDGSLRRVCLVSVAPHRERRGVPI